ncbi:MAG TPA: methyltransferase domain-containing protein [Ktedonobacterales bacterium]
MDQQTPTPEASFDALPDEWRRAFTHLVAPYQVVATASRGADDPEWQRLSEAAFPDLVGLWALALEPELLAALRENGVAPGMRVLDAACGPGVISRTLLTAGADEVIGLDLSDAMLAAARAGPSCAAGKRLSFAQGDLTQPLPFADAAFDAVFFGDFWRDEALPELQRALRPGGRLIVKMGGPAPALTYAWDARLAARVELALVEGFAHAQGGSYAQETETSGYGRLREQATMRNLRMKTYLVERFAPVPAVFALALTQHFALWEGGFLRAAADDELWNEAAALYDDAQPATLFRRPDGHFLRSFCVATATLA